MTSAAERSRRPPQDENILNNRFLGAARLAKDNPDKSSRCASVKAIALRTINKQEESPRRRALAIRLDEFSLETNPKGITDPTDLFKRLLYRSMLLPEDTKELPLVYAKECAKKITAALNENGSFRNSESRTTLESELKETLKDVPEDIQEEVKNSCLTHLKENYPNSSIRSELSKLLDKSMPISTKRFGQKIDNPVKLNAKEENPISITDADLEMFAHTEAHHSKEVKVPSDSTQKPLQKGLEETAVSKWVNHTIQPPYISDEDLKLFVE